MDCTQQLGEWLRTQWYQSTRLEEVWCSEISSMCVWRAIKWDYLTRGRWKVKRHTLYNRQSHKLNGIGVKNLVVKHTVLMLSGGQAHPVPDSFFFSYLSILIYTFLFLISLSFTFMLSALLFIQFSVFLKKVGFFSFIFRLRYIYNVTFNEFISNNKVYVFSSSVQQMSSLQSPIGNRLLVM